jgi:hypothetical protein
MVVVPLSMVVALSMEVLLHHGPSLPFYSSSSSQWAIDMIIMMIIGANENIIIVVINVTIIIKVVNVINVMVCLHSFYQ